MHIFVEPCRPRWPRRLPPLPSSHCLARPSLRAAQVRAGAGGAEASLFAWELFRMYERFAQSQGWKFDVSLTSLSLSCPMPQLVAGRLLWVCACGRVQREPCARPPAQYCFPMHAGKQQLP